MVCSEFSIQIHCEREWWERPWRWLRVERFSRAGNVKTTYGAGGKVEPSSCTIRLCSLAMVLVADDGFVNLGWAVMRYLQWNHLRVNFDTEKWQWPVGISWMDAMWYHRWHRCWCNPSFIRVCGSVIMEMGVRFFGVQLFVSSVLKICAVQCWR